MNLSTPHLTALRAYLKEFTATSVDEAHQPQADTVNALLPALIDTLSDDDLTDMMNHLWGMVITQIISPPTQPDQEESATATPAPVITLTDG